MINYFGFIDSSNVCIFVWIFADDDDDDGSGGGGVYVYVCARSQEWASEYRGAELVIIVLRVISQPGISAKGGACDVQPVGFRCPHHKCK